MPIWERREWSVTPAMSWAIQQQAAAVDVVEPGNQVHHGGLAGAGGAHQGDGLAGLHVQVEVLQDVDFPIVGEGHIVKGDTARNGRQLGGAGGVVHGDGLVDHLEDALQVGHGVDEGVVQVGQVQNGLPEPPGVGGNGNKGADLHSGGPASTGR